MIEWLAIVALGAIIGLDATSFPQIMISRPIVAGALTGLLLGEPTAGLLVGALLEVFDLSVLPIGAARYPEAGTAAVSATAAYIYATGGVLNGPALLCALLAGLALERAGGSSARWLRRRNDHIAAFDASAPPTPRALEWRHLGAIALDFGRAAVVTAVGLLAAVPFVLFGALWWSAHPMLAIGSISVLVATALGAALPVFGGWMARRWLFLAGALCGVLIALLGR